MFVDNSSLDVIDSCSKRFSLAELCCELSISVATGKNWLKVGKLKPSLFIGDLPFFTEEYVGNLKNSIINGDFSVLKSRRNKKYVSGCSFYSSYVSPNSKNLCVVDALINKIKYLDINVTDDLLRILLADCALKIILSKQSFDITPEDAFIRHIDGKFSNKVFNFLIEDLICAVSDIKDIIVKYPDLFKFSYIYEEGEDIIGLLYISLRNLGSRKLAGAYYTPTRIVKKLCENLFKINDYANKTVFDPCCGTGNFIINLPDDISYKSVYANDIDEISVKIARINYAVKYNIFDKDVIYKHIMQSDFLKTSNNNVKYDFIIGNPPWGYNFSDDEKDYLRVNYICAGGSNIESYDVFVEQSFKCLKQDGVLAFVLPEAILNVKTHVAIRKLILKVTSIQYLEYLGNSFDNVQCPSIILQLLYNKKPFSSLGTVVAIGENVFTINSQRKFVDGVLSLSMNDSEYFVIDKIANIDNKVTLKNNAIFALGIVTGDNKEYISSVKTDRNEMVLKGTDIFRYKFQPSSNYIEFEPQLYQQVAPVEYYRAKEKLLYRFICKQPVFAYDNSGVLSLNSCNILIPKIEGLDIKYIMAILNSRIASFYLNKNFNSVKILRSHIEQIPIPLADSGVQFEISNLVDTIMLSSYKEEIDRLYNILDVMISKLYSLDSDDYDVIKSALCNQNLYLY